MPVKFPPVTSANEDGLLAIGGNLDVETLTLAYQQGIFPWPVSEEYPLTWFSPDPRGILLLEDFKRPKSLEKFLKKDPYEIRFNEDFEEIIQKCADVKRSHESGTWINENIINGYIQMFKSKKAYCVGAYDNGELVGGVYGVCVGEIISGESMFYEKDNASKAALSALVEKLQEAQLSFLDTQMVTPVVASLGGKEIPRRQFMRLLERSRWERPREDIFGN